MAGSRSNGVRSTGGQPGMAKIAYHVFKKPKKTREGKEFYRWYYYYIDGNGKKIQKACPGCKNRSDAESYIRTLPPLDRPGASNPDLLLRDIAKEMYLPGSAHVDRRRQLGKSTGAETLKESRNYIDRIIADYGGRAIKGIEADEIVNRLFTVSRSGSWKNRYIAIFKEIYAEAPRHGCKIPTPDFPTFALNVKKADIFTSAELAALFKPDNFPDVQFFLFFLLILSGGLRLGEARAVRYKQINFEKKLLIVDGFCKKDGARTHYNKKGTQEKPKFRAVWLPDYTLDQLSNFLGDTALGPEDYVFSNEGRPIREEQAQNVFIRALVKAGIAHSRAKLKEDGAIIQGRFAKKTALIPDGRKLVPHSLRYTYVSRMRRELSAAEVQPLTGHISQDQVDYYNRKDLEQVVASLPKADTALETLLNFSPATA